MTTKQQTTSPILQRRDRLNHAVESLFRTALQDGEIYARQLLRLRRLQEANPYFLDAPRFSPGDQGIIEAKLWDWLLTKSRRAELLELEPETLEPFIKLAALAGMQAAQSNGEAA